MKVFISGGCKNGKSTYAESIAVELAAGRPLYYMATMIPHDEEDLQRIRNHVEARKGKGFLTVECGEGLMQALTELRKREPGAENGVFLVDSVTALLSNDYEHPEKVLGDLSSFFQNVRDAVFVSDFIYSAQEGYSKETEEYRKGLAACDRMLAKGCDRVLEICAGQALEYKNKCGGELPL